MRRKSGEADNNAVANSGCMRGNDTYGKNGSGSVGVIPLEEEKDPRQMTYNEFIHHNYGPVSQRQYP
ncbi:hypothetical protein [Pontibacter anaerobius]|uniref:Uncharacterized protein n=1 Tax=Pontibacter anaerobius TaxID=2993940 RepID=A0ABT3RH05_9BACT|nr:hypothetical protein [Pontibacter anaerobius]MCX2740778.1 hypothetical protein [Pontibacter anaerobius]